MHLGTKFAATGAMGAKTLANCMSRRSDFNGGLSNPGKKRRQIACLDDPNSMERIPDQDSAKHPPKNNQTLFWPPEQSWEKTLADYMSRRPDFNGRGPRPWFGQTSTPKSLNLILAAWAILGKTLANCMSRRPDCNGRGPRPGFGQTSTPPPPTPTPTQQTKNKNLIESASRSPPGRNKNGAEFEHLLKSGGQAWNLKVEFFWIIFLRFGSHFYHFGVTFDIIFGTLGSLVEHFGCIFRVTNKTGAPKVFQEGPPLKFRHPFGHFFEVIFYIFSYIWCKIASARNTHSFFSNSGLH